MRRCSSVLVALCACLCLLTGTALGQGVTQGTIEGTISDPSGAVVPAVKVVATNDATGVTFDVESNQDGIFRFPLLQVGTYTLKISKPGFGEQTRKSVPVTI